MDTRMPRLNADRLWARVEALSKLTVPEMPWTRRAFTPLFAHSREWLAQQFAAAGMKVRVDAGGNLIGRLEGEPSKNRAPLMTGSHCDTVPSGGRFDGIIGVLAAIEVAHSLSEQGLRMSHPLEVIDFLSEEPSDYGISCVGSRAMTGQLTPAMLGAMNADGEALTEGLRRAGGCPEDLAKALRPAGSVAAFVELHIEQGPVLEQRALPIGVVTNIVGIRRVEVVIEGRPDHAGTTPMNIRRDALVGAANLIDAVQKYACSWSDRPHYVVATVGKISVSPNASNAVPGQVELTIEVRSDDDTVLESFIEHVMASVAIRFQELRLTSRVTGLSRSRPVDCQESVMQTIEEAAASLNLPSMRLPSGAGHDAAYLAPAGPIGMIFIPCLGGRSHCPEESITPDQLLDGTRVLCKTLLMLDRNLSSGSSHDLLAPASHLSHF
jgi:N-carbamoyl-L-amino-acid hydrolase